MDKVVAFPTKRPPHSASRTKPRRGLSREEAADYIGISPTKFDEGRRDGRIPPARLMDSRRLWDIHELDVVFERLPREDSPVTGGSWDDA